MAVFEASPEGFRAMNLGRPAAHLVRELIQNVFDEAAETCNVDIKWSAKKGVYIRVADDVPGGIREEKLIFTIWESDKQDSPTKRGRMGRGLKEMVSVADWTSVATQGRPTTIFERSSFGEWSRKTTKTVAAPTVGTVVESEIKAWGEDQYREIVSYLRTIRPPSTICLFVNGEEIVRQPAEDTYRMSLTSIVFALNNNERRIQHGIFATSVELFQEAEPKVYEMGLPIEKIDFPWSIDVQQRVPLREQRDTLLQWYRAELFARVVSSHTDKIPNESLRDNYILHAAESLNHLSHEMQMRIAHAWTDGLPYATSPAMMSAATGQHIRVANLRTLPESIREIVKVRGKNVKDILRERQVADCTVLEPNYWQKLLITAWEWLAEEIERPCAVVFVGGGPANTIASFDQNKKVLALYVSNLPHDFWMAPYGPKQLGVLIHELAHWHVEEDSHGMGFHSDAENVGGAIASVLYAKRDEAGQKLW